MLKSLTTLAWTQSANLTKAMLGRGFAPAYAFSSSLESVSKLRSAVEEEVKFEESQDDGVADVRNFFENQGWKIKEKGIWVELEKSSQQYNIKIIFHAKTPMSTEDQDEQMEGEQEEDNGDYTDLIVYINKNGSSKWMCCDFMVSMNNQAQLGQLSFINDYAEDLNDRKKGQMPSSTYTGPEIMSLEEKFQESLYSFVEEVGVTGEVLQRASEYSVAYEHQFYVEWLKDFRSIV